MKGDINLLFRRRQKKYSSKKWAAILLVIAIFAGSLYAGITLPSQALAAAKLELAELEGKLVTSSITEQDLLEKTQHSEYLSEQLEDLSALSSTDSDVSAYLEAIEQSLPTNANITSLTLAGEKMSVIGIAENDAVVAAFCLRLNETDMFENVYVSSSTALAYEEQTSFSLSAKLLSSLSSPSLIQNADEYGVPTEEVSE
ncbi:MAG: PilN domain-containing protein [Eubacteriales bacterium]|nr:PilN domain-containing protein [Eubacteriales bacterium]